MKTKEKAIEQSLTLADVHLAYTPLLNKLYRQVLLISFVRWQSNFFLLLHLLEKIVTDKMADRVR